jgi:hypothetical protein
MLHDDKRLLEQRLVRQHDNPCHVQSRFASMKFGLGIATLSSIALTLSACGGGSGSTSTASDVSLTNISVPALIDETYENGDPTSKTIPSFSVTADVRGDTSSLAGKTLYVVVEDPHGFVDRAGIQQPILSNRATLEVETKTFGPRKGRYTGSFRINVCHDAACASHFGGSPIAVPYDITVLQGLVLNSNEPINFSAGANESKSVSFPLSLPEGLLYHPDTLPSPLGGRPQIDVFPMDQPSAVHWMVTMDPPPSGTIMGTIPSGLASEYLFVQAQAQTPKGRIVRLSAQVQVVYTTTP